MNIARMKLVAAGVAGLAMLAASIAVAQTSSSSSGSSNDSAAQPAGQQTGGQSSAATPSSSAPSSTQPAQTDATNPTNLPTSESGTTTPQQAKAPVVDPEKAAQDAAGSQAGGTQNATNQNATNQNANTREWPAPERYDSSRISDRNRGPGQGGASLGVNVITNQASQGVVVSRIRPGTPAEQMGLRPQDRIISLNGQPVRSVDEFITSIRAMRPGDEVQISINRGGDTRDIRGRLEALRETIATGEIRGRGDRIGESYRSGNENMQTSYEEREGGPRSRDLEGRLSRVEQQLNQLMRDISEIRTSLPSNPATSTTTPETARAGQPATRGPSAFRPTPGQPPNFQPPGTPPATR